MIGTFRPTEIGSFRPTQNGRFRPTLTTVLKLYPASVSMYPLHALKSMPAGSRIPFCDR